ncbi:hypothetical protein ACHAWF_015247 [Thalassiosira exigua]
MERSLHGRPGRRTQWNIAFRSASPPFSRTPGFAEPPRGRGRSSSRLPRRTPTTRRGVCPRGDAARPPRTSTRRGLPRRGRRIRAVLPDIPARPSGWKTARPRARASARTSKWAGSWGPRTARASAVPRSARGRAGTSAKRPARRSATATGTPKEATKVRRLPRERRRRRHRRQPARLHCWACLLLLPKLGRQHQRRRRPAPSHF